MYLLYNTPTGVLVALHPEGVDRNNMSEAELLGHIVALHPEGVDRNELRVVGVYDVLVSPSTRRAWIEISPRTGGHGCSACRPPPGGRG